MAVSNRGIPPVEGRQTDAFFGATLRRVPPTRGGEPIRRTYCAFWKKDNGSAFRQSLRNAAQGTIRISASYQIRPVIQIDSDSGVYYNKSILRSKGVFSGMEYTRLGNTGTEVSRICLGCMSFGDSSVGLTGKGWAVDEEHAREIIKKALDLGINYFDTANVYSAGTSEEFVGRALRDYARREEIVVATKVHFPMGEGPNRRGLSRKEILFEIDQSLRRLGMDYVDLYIIHRLDPNTPVEEIMDTLNDVVKSGKARYIGASSMAAWQFAKLQYTAEQHGWTKFVTMQNLYNLIYREEERDMIPLCLDQHVGLTPWSPNAKGRLARKPGTVTQRFDNEAVGKRFFPMSDQSDLEIIDRVALLAEQRGVPMIQISLAWLLSKPAVTAPILGATKLNHFEDAIAGLDSVKLTEDEIKYLEEPYTAHNVIGFD